MQALPKEADLALGKFLTEKGVLSAQDFAQADGAAAISGAGVVKACVEQQKLSEAQIMKAIADHHQFQTIELKAEQVKNRPLKEQFNDEFVSKNRCVPIKEANGTIEIAISDVDALKAVDQIKTTTQKQVQVAVTTITAMQNSIGAHGDNANDSAEVLSPKEAFMQALAKKDAPGSGAPLPGSEEGKPKLSKTGSDIIDFVNNIIETALSLRASDIHLENYEQTARLRLRCDGVLQEMDDYSSFLSENYSAIATRVKILSSLDISERRLPQDGGISFQTEDKKVDIRVSILPTNHGERIVMRLIDKEAANFKLDDLGLSEANYAKFEKAIHTPQGLILVTGPTGSGKSTTLYAGLKTLNQPDINILTAEDPVEYDLEGISQVAVREAIGLTFSAALRSFLRQDPEVIMVGEIRDKDTGDIAIKAALTGHMVFSTLHTNDAPSTVTRLINMGVPSYLITSALTLVVAQRLARKICPHCKVEDDRYGIEELMAIGFSEERAKNLKPHRGEGCDHCFGTGAKGRRAVHELLVATPDLREAIAREATEPELREVARQDGFRTMQDEGLDMIEEGIISVEEFKRILVLD